jgi:hypothetical protein
MIRTSNLVDNDGVVVSTKMHYFKEMFDKEKGYLFQNQTRFIKTFQDTPLPESTTKPDIASLFLLSKEIYADTNMIGYRGYGGVRPMTISQMAKVIRDTDRHTVSFLGRMIGTRVMARVEVTVGDETVTQYYFNPIYFFSSTRLSRNLYLLFQKDIDYVIPEYAKQKFRLVKE